MIYLMSNLRGIIMIYLLIIIAIVVLIVCLPHCFETYTNMKYVEHLEKMGMYVDENGKEI